MRLIPETPPPGPFRPTFWRSPLRGAWLTTLVGSLLLVAMTIVAATGFLSHAAYNPDLGRNAIVDRGHDFQLFVFDWPTHPSWLYAANQGLHVTIGLVAVPIVLVKLWSVIPRLYAWPPAPTPADALERLSILALVGSAIFQLATGLVNVELWYPFHFDFVRGHYYGAWIFVGALVLHVAVKLPTMRKALRERNAIVALPDGQAPPPHEPGGLEAPDPAPATIGRRGLFAALGGAMLTVAAVSAGQSIGGPLRRLAVLAPRGGGFTGGDFPINKTAAGSRVTRRLVGDSWRLQLTGASKQSLSRAQLQAMTQRAATLPIACVEGWSTTQDWGGVRMSDLARACGAPDGARCLVESVQPRGRFRQVTLSADQVADPRTLLALQVNGADLSMDHGYPARMIIPAAPGVHCTKWVGKLTFLPA